MSANASNRFAVGSLFSTAMWRLPFSFLFAPPMMAAGGLFPIVGIAVAHAASEVDDRAIQKRAVAIAGRLQFADELRKLRRVIGRQLCILSMFSGLSP